MTTIDSETLRKISQACMLLADAQADLEAYGASIPPDGGWADPKLFEKQERRERQRAAMEGILHALGTIPQALVKITAIWEALGSPEAEPATLITWGEARFGGFRGTAGGVELFTIYWHTRETDPKYALRPVLPGMTGEDKDDDVEVLKATAERRLAAWLAKVTQGAP